MLFKQGKEKIISILAYLQDYENYQNMQNLLLQLYFKVIND